MEFMVYYPVQEVASGGCESDKAFTADASAPKPNELKEVNL